MFCARLVSCPRFCRSSQHQVDTTQAFIAIGDCHHIEGARTMLLPTCHPHLGDEHLCQPVQLWRGSTDGGGGLNHLEATGSTKISA
jgi:hypothetical protein